MKKSILARKWDLFNLPKDMSGKTFLDIGTWDGAFCAEAIQRGADRAVGVDMHVCNDLKDSIKTYDFEFYQMDIQGDRFLTLDSFDIVSFCGVLYHLSDPMGSLIKMRNVCNDLLVVETRASTGNQPTMLFTKNEVSNWWAPTQTCLYQMLEVSGFKNINKVWSAKHAAFNRICLHATASKRQGLMKGSARTIGFRDFEKPNPT